MHTLPLGKMQEVVATEEMGRTVAVFRGVVAAIFFLPGALAFAFGAEPTFAWVDPSWV